MRQYEFVVAAFHCSQQKKNILVLEAASQVGGRTSNWKQDGMDVESGLHKFFGVYKEFPALLKASVAIPDRLPLRQ